MDSLDFKIIKALLENGRITLTELASQINLSIPSTTERVKKLEEQKVIKGYSANLDYYELGFAIMALIFVTLDHPQHRAMFIKTIQNTQEVLECLHITGDDDYFLKVVCLNGKHLDAFLNDVLKVIPGVKKTRTIIALSAPKERSTEIPEIVKKGIK